MHENESLKKTLIISATLIILAVILVIAFKNPFARNTISVDGSASVDAMPDLVGIYFNVETSGDTTEEASNANSEIVDEMTDSLLALGIKEDEIITQGYNVYQDYDWVNGNRVERGYKATHSIKVELSTDETDKIGKVVDAGTDAGAGISYINFELTQELQNQYKAQAMQLAAEDAKMKADAVAEGIGKKAGRLISISTSNFGYSPWNIYSSGGMDIAEEAVQAKAATTDIQPGEQKIYGQVTAIFKIK